jgi:hypothetical protein
VKRICIVGASECGKTTLAIHMSRAFWSQHHIASLVLDPRKNKNNWGPQAWVTTEAQTFSEAVWKRKGDLVIMDEGSSTIARDKDLIPMFTQIRHENHNLLVICHNATNMLPDMRQNLNELFLFAQTKKSIELWQDDLPMMRGISRAMAVDGKCELGDYEFIWCRNNKDGEKRKLRL